MNIVIVSGSKRKGNSEYIADALVDCLKGLEECINVTCLKLSEIEMDFCTGCLLCDETARCCIDDEMTNLVDVIANADGMILISPARWSLISGEMKTFLDRLNPLAVSMKLAGKKCITITIGQSDESEGDSIIAASNSFRAFADNAEMIVYRQIEIFSCLIANDISSRHDEIERCKKASIDLVGYITE